jgi:hypothetical protein
MTQPYNPQFGAPVQPQQGYPINPQFGAPQQLMQPLPVQPGYPPQQYGQIPPPAQPQAPLAQGTLDDFFDQPTVGGGQALKFAQLGTEYYVEVTRPITKADVQQQTDTRNIPQYFKDGRPKFQMLVPVHVLNSNVPDAIGTTSVFYLKGATREKLAAAMAHAGAPAGPPEAGCRMRLRYAADVPTGAGFNPRKDIDIVYERPAAANSGESQLPPEVHAEQQAAAPLPQMQVPQAPPVQQPLPQMQYGPQVTTPPWTPPQMTMPTDPQPAPQQPVVQQANGLPAPPAGLTPEQQAAYATILAQTGQQPQG